MQPDCIFLVFASTKCERVGYNECKRRKQCKDTIAEKQEETMSYQEHFEQIVKDQLERVERMKNAPAAPDFASMDKVVIGAIDGDGIGPIIMDSCREILNKLLADEIADGKIEIRTIKGLTIENRVEKLQAVPDDVLAEIKECDLLLKGPTMTPGKGDNLPNIESANVKLRKELDLFANVRPVVIPEKGIDWMFFRENTEGEYALGNRGIDINDDISIDFKVTTNDYERVFKPQDLGFDVATPEELVGGATEEEAKQIFDRVLANEALPAQKNIVLANAAFGIQVLERGKKSIEECIAIARESIDSGKAMATFKKFVELNS